MARVSKQLSEGINRTMVDFLMENYERYYIFAYSMVKNEEQTKRILSNIVYYSLYNSRKLKRLPTVSIWFFQLLVRDGMRKMHELNKYKRDFTTESQLYAYMETIEPSAVNAFKLYYFEDFTINQVGEILRMRNSEVEKRLKMVRQELHIDKYMDDESADRLQELIDVYESPEIPDDLESIITKAVEKERTEYEEHDRKERVLRWLRPTILIIAVAVWFFGTIAVARQNASFGEMVLSVPIVNHLFSPFIT